MKFFTLSSTRDNNCFSSKFALHLGKYFSLDQEISDGELISTKTRCSIKTVLMIKLS